MSPVQLEQNAGSVYIVDVLEVDVVETEVVEVVVSTPASTPTPLNLAFKVPILV
jgi:hypothetical protein